MAPRKRRFEKEEPAKATEATAAAATQSSTRRVTRSMSRGASSANPVEEPAKKKAKGAQAKKKEPKKEEAKEEAEAAGEEEAAKAEETEEKAAEEAKSEKGKEKVEDGDEEEGEGKGEATEKNAGDESNKKKTIVIEHCKQCNSFKTRANQVKDGLEKGVSGITVQINPDKPRRGCFEIREEGGQTFISLLGMKRPFQPMKDLNMEEVINDIVEKIK